MSIYYSSSTNGFYDTAIHSAEQIPSDALEITKEQHAALLAAQSRGFEIVSGGNGTPMAANPPAPSTEKTVSSYIAAAQEFLDSTARSWGYDSLLSATSYQASGVVKFAAEARILFAWRDAVWFRAIALQDAVKAGTYSMPGSVNEFLSMLPHPPSRPS